MLITKLNNAAIVVTTGATSIAVDIGKDVPTSDLSALTVDAVFVSHVHPDHFDRANLEHLRRPVYGPPEVYEALAQCQLDVTEVLAGEQLRVGDLTVDSRVVDHGPISLPILNLGFEISSSQHRAWFAGDIARDTTPLPEGPFDVVLLPVGGGKVFDPSAAVAYASRFPGAAIIPIHYDYSMTAFMTFHELARARDLKILPIGIREQATIARRGAIAR